MIDFFETDHFPDCGDGWKRQKREGVGEMNCRPGRVVGHRFQPHAAEECDHYGRTRPREHPLQPQGHRRDPPFSPQLRFCDGQVHPLLRLPWTSPAQTSFLQCLLASHSTWSAQAADSIVAPAEEQQTLQEWMSCRHRLSRIMPSLAFSIANFNGEYQRSLLFSWFSIRLNEFQILCKWRWGVSFIQLE